MMPLTWYIDLVISAIDEMFGHLVGLYAVFDFDIVNFLIASLTIIGVLRLLTNGSFSLTKTIDSPSTPDSDKTKKLDQDVDSSMDENSSEK